MRHVGHLTKNVIDQDRLFTRLMGGKQVVFIPTIFYEGVLAGGGQSESLYLREVDCGDLLYQ